jgi:hypothetical protein
VLGSFAAGGVAHQIRNPGSAAINMNATYAEAPPRPIHQQSSGNVEGRNPHHPRRGAAREI